MSCGTPGMSLFSLFQQLSSPYLQHQFNKGSKVLHFHFKLSFHEWVEDGST